MVVAVLGILKAGGADVPVDEKFPAERLDFMLKDSGARVLLTEERLDADWEKIGACSAENPARVFTNQRRAYVIYTSGSTGRPKGVEVSHRSVVNLLNSIAKRPSFKATDTMLSVATLSFDIAVAEIFLPLIAGG